MRKTSFRLVSSLMCGCGLGWLVGLSASPVLHLVVTAVLSLAAGTITALYPAKDDVPHATLATKEEIPPASHSSHSPKSGPVSQPSPPLFSNGENRMVTLAALVLGVAIGATCGVYARANDWLGVKPESFIDRWKSAGLPDQTISRKLLDHLYPTPPSEETIQTPAGGTSADGRAAKPPLQEEAPTTQALTQSAVHSGTLLSNTGPECNSMRGKEGEDLRTELRSSTRANVRSFAELCSSNACLKAAVEELICGPSTAH